MSTRGRRRRELSEAEKALWAKVAESIEPLPGRAAEPVDAYAAIPPAVDPPRPAVKASPERPRPPSATSPAALLRPSPPPLAPLEARLKRRLSRGVVEVDARIDLHGLRQDEAQRRLAGFLLNAQASGCRVALVITGKGRPSEDADPFGFERGVLKRAVPMWLGSPAARGYVIGFETAHAVHGGAGALYVRIRRR